MTHLVIAGHGKQRNNTFDPGATGFIKKGEHKYVVEDLFPAMKKHLPKGHDIVFFDKYKVSNYGNIAALAKEYKARQITEIHFDAATASTARGGHVIVHSDFSPDKTDLALRDAIKKVVGVRYSHKGHDGISGRNNLLNVNQTAKSGITYRLIELGFGSNKEDADILTGKVDEYAKELVKAITGKVSDKPNTPKPKPTPSKPTASGTYTVKKGDTLSAIASKNKTTVAALQKDNGIKNANLIKVGQVLKFGAQKAPAKPTATPKPKPATKPKESLVVDGYLGKATYSALQRYFGTYVDGVISKPSPMVKALQKLLGVTQDGYWGADTNRALQRRFGTFVDGAISRPSPVIKELQRRLNKGKL